MGLKRKPSYYAVKVGRQPGVYSTWDETKAQVLGVSGAVHKGFATQQEAEEWLSGSSSGGAAAKRARREPAGPRRTSTPAPPPLYRVECAGVVHGTLGAAGCAAVLCEHATNAVVGRAARFLAADASGGGGGGERYAQYHGLLLGLAAARALSLQRLVLHTEVALAAGRKDADAGACKSLAAQADALQRRFASCDTVVDRDGVRVARELAGLVADLGEGWEGLQDERGDAMLPAGALDAELVAAVEAAAGREALDADAGCAAGAMPHGVSGAAGEGAQALAPARTPAALDPAPLYQMEFDGAARGNPGPAGLGAVLRVAAGGREVATLCYFVARATNNQAEYCALLLGLQAARALGVQRLQVLGDSKLVVQQVCGAWDTKNDTMRQLCKEVVALKHEFKEFRITHVYRDANKRADALSNEAIDMGGWDGVKVHGTGIVPFDALDVRTLCRKALAASR